MPYRSAARAETDAVGASTAPFVLSRAAVVAASALAVIALVAGLAMREPATGLRLLARRPAAPPHSVETARPPGPLETASPSPAPLVRGGLPPRLPGDYAPAGFAVGGELELAAGRYPARITSDDLFGLAPGTRCEVELASDGSRCALEVRCGDRLLYASSADGAFFCEHGAGGGVTTMLDRGLSLMDGSPVLTQDWSDGYGLELNDFGPSGWGRTRLLLAPSARPFGVPLVL